MKRASALLLVTLMAVVLAGAAVSGSRGASGSRAAIPLLRVGLNPAIPSMDVSHGNTAERIANLSLETLMRIGQDGKLYPWLAKSVTQPNATTYVYHLRRGVRFWNGNELTSADVVGSWEYERILGGWAFTAVKRIKATGRYKVTVTLKTPDASWAFKAGNFALGIFEKRFLDKHRDTFGKPGTLVMGTGPWIPVSLDPTRGAEFRANPRYWGGKVQIQRISIKFFASETSEALAFRAGAIDVAIPSAPQSFAATAGTKPVTVPNCGTGLFSMNTQAPPWNDVHVRRAVAYALNGADLAKANGGFASLTHTLLPRVLLKGLGTPAQVTAALKSVPVYKFNLAKARQELAKSAYPNGFKFELPTAAIGNFSQVNQVIAAQLAKIGISAEVKDLGSPGAWYAAATVEPKERPAIFFTAGCNSPDPSVYNWLLGSENAAKGLFNLASYAPPAVDKLIAETVAATNQTKRLEAYRKLLRRLGTDVPYVPLFAPLQTLVISDKFKWPTFDFLWFSRPWALGIQPRK